MKVPRPVGSGRSSVVAMPGAAARTSGIAFTIRPHAATIAAWLWSPCSLLGMLSVSS